jgi:outer membrane immunogenic protein
MGHFSRFVVMAALTAIHFMVLTGSSLAQSDSEILLRLEAKVDSLTQENAALRNRVRRLEQGKVSPTVTASPIVASAQVTKSALAKEVIVPQPWTGIYVGGNLGYGWSDPTSRTSNTVTDTAFNSSVLVPLNPSEYTTPNNGWIGGITAGYNYQFGRNILGIESDFEWSGAGGNTQISAICSGFFAAPPNCSYSQGQKLDWLATIRGRVGFVVIPETMIYGTGGVAFGHVGVAYSLQSNTFAGLYTANAATSATETGWVVGAGIESAIMPDWLVRLEVLHYDLGTISSNAPVFVNGLASPWTVQTNFRTNGDLARVGLMYKFH